MYRIFIVEDESEIAQSVQALLEQWGLQVHCATHFDNILTQFTACDPHLVLLDISLPFYNGYYWCAQIRKHSTAPIVFLSSASDSMNIVMAMNMGADDFIAKPFDPQVLCAKVQALLRRTYDMNMPAHLLKFGNVFLDTAKHTLTYQTQLLPLSKNEYGIMEALMEQHGAIVRREYLMEHLWNTDCFVDENTLSVNVTRLRKKLEVMGLSGLIETKFGEGYRLVLPSDKDLQTDAHKNKTTGENQ